MGLQRPWRWNLPLSVADPYLMGELAMDLHMTLSDLGVRASNWEVCVFWPAWREERARLERIQLKRQEQQQRGAR